MTSIDLTREEAAARSAAITVTHQRVTLDLTDGAGNPAGETFRSTSEIEFLAAPGSATFLDLRDASIRRIEVNGTPLPTTAWTRIGGIALEGLAESNKVVVEAELRFSTSGEGLHRFVDPLDGETYLYSQFETADAKRVFACFDQPDMKTTFDITVIAPAHWSVVSNTDAVVRDNPDGSRTHGFATTRPLPTYLVAVIAGPFASWHSEYEHDGTTIPLGLWCRASLAEHMDADRLFDETRRGFDFYHRAFGVPYPFGKYDQLFVPEFNFGAMENAGAVTFREEYVFRSRVTRYLYERRSETLLHELAHMWFGNLVTMRWWDDLWLNESFATFASVLCQAEATEFENAWTTFANVEKAWAQRQDELPSTHPIAADMVDVSAVDANFDGITYAKGASVLKQLVAYVGRDAFLGGLRDYFREHAWGNAEFGDLVRALEASSGRDLSAWGEQWLRTTGLNTLEADYDLDEQGRFTRFEIVQGGARPGGGEFRDHRVAVGIHAAVNRPGELVDDEILVRTHRVEVDVRGARTPVPSLIGVHGGDLVLVNDDDLTYCDPILDDRSLAVVAERIGEIGDPLARTLCWSAVWQMTRSGRMRAREYIDIVCRGIAGETEVGVVQKVLAQAQTTLDRYADEGWAAETGWHRLASRILELARNSEAGSDHQLAFVEALAGCVLSAEHIDTLGAIVYRSPEDVGLAGLAVDADMRWTILTALVASGAAGEEEIAAEEARDPSAAGALRAATARAAAPTSEGKARVLAELLAPTSTLTNALVRARIAGYHRVGQTALLADHADHYLAGITGLWGDGGGEIAQTVTEGMFPTWDLSDATRDRVADLIGAGGPGVLLRLLREGTDEAARAARCREVDAG